MKTSMMGIVLFSVVTGCAANEELPIADTVQGAEQALEQGEASEFAGFVHREKSRMFIGTEIARDRSFEFERIVGADGVLAFGRHGATMGILNNDSKALSSAPFAGTGEEHNRAVVEYFEQSGLPAAQRGPVHVKTYMAATGTKEERLKGVPMKPVFEGYASVVDRELDGVAVRGSYAWARINADAQVLAEEVFWPPISTALVDEAHALAKQLANEGLSPEFLARAGEEYRALQPLVVIFHSPHMRDDFKAVVAIEFPGSKRLARFSPSGELIRFPAGERPLSPPRVKQ